MNKLIAEKRKLRYSNRELPKIDRNKEVEP